MDNNPWLEKYIEAMRGDLKADIAEVRSDVKKLLQFKWQIVGGSLIASGVLTILLQIVIAIWQARH